MFHQFISIKYVTLEERRLLPFPNSFQLFETVLLVFLCHPLLHKNKWLTFKSFYKPDAKLQCPFLVFFFSLSTYTMIQFQKKDLERFAQL